MTKELKTIFRRVGDDTYGPKATNPMYEVTTPDGRVWKVSRHKWELHGTRWAWSAEYRNSDGTREHKYGDTLDELARWELRIPMAEES